jgi:hypothetical protein
MKNLKVVVANRGGVSYEESRSAYRGSVNIAGKRHRTKYYATRIGARRALTRLINSLTTAAS